MTKKNLIIFLLAASYTACLFILGCFPNDTLQWSADGSIGIYSKQNALFLVDGNTGTVTQVAAKGTTTRWPAISPDGSQFAYGEIVEVDDFNRAFGLLPADQAELIKAHAEILRQKILIEGIKDSNFPFVGEPVATDDGLKDSFSDQHIAWVRRYLVESGDAQLIWKIGTELIKKTKSQYLTYYRLICAPTAEAKKQKVLATSAMQLWRIRFSPDNRLIAYGADRYNGDAWDVGYDLYVVSTDAKIPAVLLAPAAAVGYDFKSDSRKIAYIKPEDELFDDERFTLGSLVEQTIVDDDGQLLAEPAISDSNDSATEYVCTADATELAGVLYYPWTHVSYGAGNRIFFTSAKICLPTSKLDEEEQTIFCLDTLTGAVSEILPQVAVKVLQGNLYLFALSHDSRQMLLPGSKNTLGLYTLGGDLNLSKILIDEDESFGEDTPPKLVAQWKGPDGICCLVSEKSHFLTDDPNTPHSRKEIVILDTDGNLKQVLSKDWPDELLDF